MNFLVSLSLVIAFLSAQTTDQALDSDVVKRLAPTNAGERIRGFAAAAVADAELTVDQPVRCSVVLSNHGLIDGRGAEGQLAGYTCHLFDESGKAVPLTRYGKRLLAGGWSVVFVRYPPGTERKTVLHLSRLFDMSLSGTYYFYVSKRIALGQAGEKLEVVEVVSNVVAINVTELESKPSDGNMVESGTEHLD